MEETSNNTKQLRFARRLRIKKVPHFSDYPEKQWKQIWITKGDLQSFRDEFRETVHLFNANQLKADNDDYCLRGTEVVINLAENQKLKKQAVEAVLTEYKMQAEEGVVNDDFIRQVYQRFSRESVLSAHRQAIEDAEDASIANPCEHSHGSVRDLILGVRQEFDKLTKKHQRSPKSANGMSVDSVRRRRLQKLANNSRKGDSKKDSVDNGGRSGKSTHSKSFRPPLPVTSNSRAEI